MSETFPAEPAAAGLARALVAAVLGEAYPQAEVAVLLGAGDEQRAQQRVGGPGGVVTVVVSIAAGAVRVAVTDRSGDGTVLVPVAAGDDGTDESRGMRLVDVLAARWGFERGGGFATTWFELASA